MAASGAKYGMMTSHFYWIGAIPAMVFVGIFMMPFYYGSRARSVPEYLQLRFDEKTRGLQRHHLRGDDRAVLRHLHVRPRQAAGAGAGLELPRQRAGLGRDRPGLHLPRRSHLGDLQRGAPVLPDRAGLPAAGAAGASGTSAAGRASRRSSSRSPPVRAIRAGAWSRVVATSRVRRGEPHGRRMVRPGDGTGFRAVVRLLVHGLPGGPAGHGSGVHDRRPADAAARRRAQDALPAAGDRARHDRDRPASPPAAACCRSGRTGRRTTTSRCRCCWRTTSPRACWDSVSPRSWPRSCRAWRGTSPPSTPCGRTTSTSRTSSPDRSDHHYLRMGHAATVFGILLSVAAAYAATRFNNIMDMLQLVFAFVNAPLFATFLLGMFWRRATGHGAFFGLLIGTLAAAAAPWADAAGRAPCRASRAASWAPHSTCTRARWPRTSGPRSWRGPPASWRRSSSRWRPRRHKTDDELRGLVYSLTPRITDAELVWYKRPATLGVTVLALTLVLNIIFW